MLERESYWTRMGPPTPEFTDLPSGTTSGTEESWNSLSPGMRRTVWRDAIHREAASRNLSDDILFRLKVATIDGSVATLDEYLMVFESQDAKRAAIREDADRLQRADEKHRQGEVQIAAREAL